MNKGTVQNRSKRVTSFATLAAVRGRKPEDLSQFITPEDKALFTIAAAGLVKADASALKAALAKLFADEEFAMLKDIHPAWILESLTHESPKVIGLILRFLPSKHVRHILEHLPKRTKLLLPKLVDSFAVPTALLNLVRRRFENGFIVMERELLGQHPVFQKLYRITASEFDAFFEDVGLHEMAIAFQKMQGLKMLLNRLSVTRARALQRRIKEVAGVDERIVKEARYAILSMTSPEMDEKELLRELGIFAFANSFSKDEQKLVNVFKLKLEPKLSYLLQRYVKRAVKSNVAAVTRIRQEMVTQRLEKLVGAGVVTIA